MNIDYIINYLNNKNLDDINNNDIKEIYNYINSNDNNINFIDFYKNFIIILNNEINKKDNINIKNNYIFYDHKINYLNNEIKNLKNLIKEMNEVKNKIMIEKVKFIEKLNQPEQRSNEWYEMRKNMLTASDIGAILGYSKYNSRKSIIKKKTVGSTFKGNKYTLHGQKYEEIAKQIYETRYNKIVNEYGLIKHPEIDILGASPDGISNDGIMLEIKCPPKRKITGIVPEHYWVQMQVQLQVCKLERCDFIECLIEEYQDYEDYLEDSFDEDDFEYYDIIPKTFDINHINVPSDRQTVNGLEKGIIGEIRVQINDNDFESKYFYPPFNLTSKQQNEWLDNKSKEIGKYITKIYWHLKFSSVVKVDRDDKWWEKNNVVQKLYDTWDEIKKERNKIKKKKENETYDDNDDGIIIDFSNLKSELPKNDFYDSLPKCEFSDDDNNICLLSDDDNLNNKKINNNDDNKNIYNFNSLNTDDKCLLSD